MEEIVLKTYNISKKYGNQVSNDKISITIKKGEIYGLIGKNGAGKTTLFRIITGLSHKSSGNLEMFGKSEEKDLNTARTMIGSLNDSKRKS